MLKYCFHSFILATSIATIAAGEFPAPYNTEKEEKAPMSAEEAAATAELPDGFRLEVFASEPEVQQPISISFDDKGRLWVAECYTFAERPLRWDLELRDRVIVLEDTSGDGKSDKRTVFWDEGTRMTSAIPGRGGVWVLCAPELLFIPDADGDLVPDGDPVVVLDGFDAENIGHNMVNGLKWGPDGWLYGRHGITATSYVGAPGTSKNRRTALNCSIWRFHPETAQFEVFCNGGTNPWGLDWDKNGQLFYTNTVIGHLWHGIPGAYYTRMFGAHLNRHAYEVITHTADHYHWDTGAEKWNDIRDGVTSSTSELGGGHAHMGCLIYEGGVWPKEYHGNLFACNLHGRRINRDILEPEGVGFVAHHGKDFLMMKDPWFRGLDLITGPDGQVWINDWSDTGECHDNDAIHRTSGRIYRIVYDGAEKGEPTPSRPEWLTSRAKKRSFEARDIEELLSSKDSGKQAMGVRWLSEDFPDEKETVERLIELANGSAPGLARLELAAALQRLPAENRFRLAEALASIEEDANDRQQPLMIWYGLSEVVPDYPNESIQLAMKSKHPSLTRLIARRICEGIENSPEPVESLLSEAAKSQGGTAPIVLAGVSEALKGWAKAPKPKAWDEFSGSLARLSAPSIDESLRELSVLFGDGRAREELLAIATDGEGEPGARRAALDSLLRQPSDDLLPLLKKWVNDKILSREAVRGLAAYEDTSVPAQLIRHWRQRPDNQTAVVDTLVSRGSYATKLLEAIASKDLPREAISPFQARQIVSLGDAKLKGQLQDVWGEVRETAEAKKKEIAEWKGLLTKDAISVASPARGKAVFAQSCGACHLLYGEGGKIGPDLTGSDRHSLDYLLGNTINPNDIIPADYRLTVFTLKDGRVVSGVVPEENEKTVTVQSAAEKIIVNTSDVEKRETMPVSLMPEGLLKALGEDAVKDLIAYLMTTTPIQE